MITTSHVYRYKAFGLILNSVLKLPECLQCQPMDDARAQVFIRVKPLTEVWEHVAKPKKLLHCEENRVMFKVPDTALFAIEEGCRIWVSPFEEADMDKLRLYILGTCMGVILMQRGILPLHGSAVAINGKVYALVGHSGAGKSTLATVLTRKGYPLLSDDVIAVSLKEHEGPVVHPSYPQQKLWIDSIQKLSLEESSLSPLFERELKFAVPISDRFCKESLPLSGVIELVQGHGNNAKLCQIQGLERLALLNRHTYRQFILERSGLLAWHFERMTQLLHHVQVMQMHRPKTGFSAYEMANIVVSECT